MKVVILAGGFGTRLSEETISKPKPLVEIGGRPILWHIMKHYAHHSFKEFYIALGYKGEQIKRYFLDYCTLNGNISIHLAAGKVEVSDKTTEDWVVRMVDTGLQSQTGGRVKRLQPLLKDETFMLTYGDGVANLDLSGLLQFHQSHDCIATVTAVRPPARFGGLIFNGDMVAEFTEKPQIGEGWINGGFMVFEPEIFNYIKDDDTVLERDVLEALAVEGQLAAYRHEGFWQCTDTLRDVRLLESIWQSGSIPWKVWTE
jgi:glucose-1-phosphate cytidylyltransferase